MKVAVLVINTNPALGGDYTWSQALLGALGEAAKELDHEPVVVGPDPARLQQLVGGSTISIVELPSASSRTPLVENLQRARRLRNRLLSEVFRHVPGEWTATGPKRAQEDRLVRFEAMLEANGIDLVWYPTIRFPHYVHYPHYAGGSTPYVATVWDLQHRLQPVFPEVGGAAEWSGRERMYETHLRRASIVLAGSDRCKEEVSFFYQVPPERIEVVAFPTPSFALNADEAEEPEALLRRLGVGGQYFVYPAQYWPHKNHVNLLLALDLLARRRGLRPGLVLVGSDRHAQEAYVRRWVAELGLEKQVRMLGFVPVDALVALYRGAVALPYVSFFGPDNLPPLEAFALGCPVIASDVPGARAQYGDAAVYVDPTDVGAIAAAMAALCDSEETRQLHSARGRERAKTWTAQDYVRRVFSLFDRLEAVRRCWGSRWE